MRKGIRPDPGMPTRPLAELGSAVARRAPRWARVALGVACVVVGAVLTAEPVRSLSVLVWLVAAGLILSGASEFASSDAAPRPGLSRLTGIFWIVVAIVAVSWPGVTILTLAIAVGVALVVGGALKVIGALVGGGDERFILGLSGLTNCIVGALALTWPALTVLALAVLFGVRTIVFGVSQIALSFARRREQDAESSDQRRHWSLRLRLVGTVVAFGLALGGAAISVAVQRARHGRCGAAVRTVAPSRLSDASGRRGRRTVHRRGVRDRRHGLSGPRDVRAAPLPRRGFRSDERSRQRPRGAQPARGSCRHRRRRVGPLPGRARVAVHRAARRDLRSGAAPARCVAAGAPVPDLVDLFQVNIQTRVGKILIAMALQSWERAYDDADLDQIVVPVARPVVARIAENCLYDTPQILGSVPAALALDLAFLRTPPWEVEPWKTIVMENNPGTAPIGVPILVVQSDVDTIVAADVTARFVDRLCERGETVELLRLVGISHLETGHEAAPEVADWLADRLAAEPLSSPCA